MGTAIKIDEYSGPRETLNSAMAPMCGVGTLQELAARGIDAVLKATALDSSALVITGTHIDADRVYCERGFAEGFCESLVRRSLPLHRLLRTAEPVFLGRSKLHALGPDGRGRRLQLLGAIPISDGPPGAGGKQLACILVGAYDENAQFSADAEELVCSAVSQMSGALRCRLRTEREKELLEADISQVFAHLSCGLLVTRLADESCDPRSGVVALANPLALEMLGLPPYAVGTPLSRWLKEADILLEREEQACRHTIEIDTPDGKRLLGFSNVHARLPLGPSVITLFQDIGKTRRIEERRRHAEQLAHVGEMAARLSHDLSNPLASLRAGLEFISRAAKLEPKHREMVDVLFSEIDKMSTLTRSLLDATKPSEITTLPQRLIELVRESLSIYRNLAQQRAIVLEFDADPANDMAVTVDRNMFTRVVSNLVINAIEAIGARGRVRVACRLLAADEIEARFSGFAGSVALIEVADDGPGISPDARDEVFKPFYTTKDHGTGLGLAVVKDIVEQYGGIITVDSVEGQGTTFSIFLPRSSPDPCWVLAQQGDTSCNRNCGLCIMRKSGGYLCWSHLGRAEYMETGEWHRPCHQCRVFLSSNLTPWANE